MAATIVLTSAAGTNAPYKLGSPPDFGTLYSGRALEFDGVTDYVAISDDISLKIGTDSFTLSVWFKHTESSGTHMILEKRTAGGVGYRFGIDDGTALIAGAKSGSGGGESAYSYIGVSGSNDGKWHHYVATFDKSSTIVQYFDGVIKKDDVSLTGVGDISNTLDLNIGANNTPGAYWDGNITNVQIWNKTWSLSDVQYAYTHPEKLITDNSAVTSGTTISNLKAWYPCTEGNPRSPQTTVYDGSPKELGSEVLADPTFDDDTTVSVDGTHWSITNGTISEGEEFYIGGGKLVSVGGQDARLTDYSILTSGVLYRFQITLDSVGNSGRIRGSNNNTMSDITGIETTGVGTYTRYFVADGTTFSIDCDATADFTATDISVKEVQMGNHGTTTFYGDELVTNGTMEADSNWADYNSVSSNTRSTTQEHAGTYSRKFIPDGASQGIKGDTFTTVAGRTYAVDFWVYPDDGTIVRYAVRKGDASGWAGDAAVTGLTENAWNNVTGTYTEVAGGSGAYIAIHSSSQESGDFYIDDVSIKEVGVAGGWTTADAEPLIPQTALMGMSKPMVFDAIDDYVTCGTHESLNPASAITISAWVYPETLDNWRYVVDRTADSNGAYRVELGATDFYVAFGTGSAMSAISKTHGMSVNNWYHIVVTYNSTTAEMYINGASLGTTSISRAMLDSDYAVTIGKPGGGGGNYFDGIINEVSIWSSALSGAEVQELFNDGVALDATAHSASSDLVGYWRNDGASTWTDRSTNSNNGTPAGSPDTILLPEGTTAGKDILGFPLTHTNNGWLNLTGGVHASGVGTYVDVADNDVLDIESEVTVEAWAKTDTTVSERFIVQKHSQEYGLEMDGAVFRGILRTAGGLVYYSTTDTAVVGTWYHIVMTYDGANVKMYKDAVLKTTTAETTNIVTSATSLRIGCLTTSATGGAYPFDGSVDEVKIYNRTLTLAEISKNYKHGKSKHS